jgi:hypothetical protein
MAITATGSYWNTTNPDKPVGKFDPNAIIDFPIGLTDWLAKLGTTYASHTIIADTPLECVASSQSGGDLTVRIQLVASATFTVGAKYPFTVRLVGADGQQDDRTFWLKLQNR